MESYTERAKKAWVTRRKNGREASWNKGVPMREETKKKLSLARKGRPAPWMIGNKYIGEGKKNPNYGKFGRKHPKWKENKKKPFHDLIRTLYRYRQWRSDIFTRDNFTCVLCGIGGGIYIEADHYPKMFIEIINEYNIKTVEDALACEELWNINNGRTLCKKCHDPTRGKRPKDLTK